jgi:hypothetical protein
VCRLPWRTGDHERGPHVGGRLIAFVSILGTGDLDDGVEGRLLNRGVELVGVGADVSEHDRTDLRRLDHAPAGDTLCDDQAERVDVGPGVGPFEIVDELGRHVLRRADSAAGLRLDVGRFADHLGNAEVEDLDRVRLADQVDQHHVVGLQVAVDDSLVMGLDERAEYLVHDADDAVGRQRPVLPEDVAERLPANELHDEVRQVVLGVAEISHPHRRGVLQPFHDLDLLDESLGPLKVVVVQRLRDHNLDGYFGIEPELSRMKDDAETTSAELFEYLVAADLVADRRNNVIECCHRCLARLAGECCGVNGRPVQQAC